jgi:hypothetical protein
MFRRVPQVLAAALLLLIPAASRANLSSYNQNFETLVKADPSALANNGWLVYGNVFNLSHVFQYGYGAFGAPNGTGAFCDIDAGQGGLQQGTQQLSVYSDYNNPDQLTKLIEANVFQQQTIGLIDAHTTWTLQFDAKLGLLVGPTTALAFIKTIDPNNNYAMTNLVTVDMTAIPGTWNTYSISLPIIAPLDGQFLQFGFASTTTNYAGSGVFYDNISFTKTATSGVDGSARTGVLELRPASPNPFRNSTALGYSLPGQGMADVTIYDVTGRRVATVFRGLADAGPHVATWDGRGSDGQLAPAGIYRAVLQTAAGRQSRSLVLSR